MAGVKVVTRKLVTFQGEDEEFSNTYYFGNGPAGGQIDGEAVVNAVIAAERPIFATIVRFLGGSSQPLGIFDNPNQAVEPDKVELPAGVFGTATGTANLYRECAVDVRWTLGGRRTLRNLLHTMVSHGHDISGATATVPANLTAALTTFGTNMLSGTFGGCQRMSPDGTRPSEVVFGKYLEHRQFHRYRRR